MSPAEPGGWRRRAVLALLQALPALPWLAQGAEARPLPRPPAGPEWEDQERVFAPGVFEDDVFE